MRVIPPPPPPFTVVVCLADGTFRAAADAALEALGAETVLDVASPAAALEAVALREPELLVIDLSLTGMGGWRYLQRLATEHPRCRLVVVSPLGALPLAALEVGALAVLAEGDIAGLRTVVRGAMAGRQPGPVLELDDAGAVPGSPVDPAGSRRRNAPLS